MLVKQSKLPLDGIATTNYFQALQTMEVRFKSTELTEDPTFGVRHQVLPLGVKRPDALQTSTESAFFVEKHHTKIKKATKASFVPEVAEAMLNDENTALLSLSPTVLMPPTASALALTMLEGGSAIDEVSQLHAINRVLCATNQTEDNTFNNKWKKLMGTAVPSKRGEIYTLCAKW
uniref:Serpin domain-containing protein n=1 Tax=Peronospora matthiolae TaxID=2874970 RepID=A0AAV1UGF2_9STRA